MLLKTLLFRPVKLKWLPVFVVVCALSCKKDGKLQGISLTNPQAPPVKDSIALNVFVDDSKPGYPVSHLFEGFSYETALLAQNPEYLNSQNQVLINMVNNLGKGVLRIGGNSSDLMNWAGNTSDTAHNIVTAAQIDRLADFSKATGWPVIFGLNLANKEVNAASTEAGYMYKKLGHNLLALQNGNEPDVYGMGPRPKSYSYNKFCMEWHNYFQSIKKTAPGVDFAGPDVTPFNNTWLRSFSAQENQNISMIDGHYYTTGPASNPGIVYTDILNDNKDLYGYLATLNEISQKTKKPFRISECNSVFGKGKPGVSNVFASALWALDFMWKVAGNGGQGVNFHGGNTSFIYSPIAHPGNEFVAQPEYYAMLAFKYGAVGQTIIPAEMDNRGYNMNAHAVINHKKGYSVTLINKELNTNAIFTVKFSKNIENVSVARLSSPSITSEDGVTFAGSQVNADGTFRPDITEAYKINSTSITIKLPASSAAVVTVY